MELIVIVIIIIIIMTVTIITFLINQGKVRQTPSPYSLYIFQFSSPDCLDTYIYINASLASYLVIVWAVKDMKEHLSERWTLSKVVCNGVVRI